MLRARPDAVDLLVVEDVGARAALLLGEGGQRRALVGVLGQHARVGALAGRVVLVRLAGLGAGVVGGDADRGVARADLGDAGLVEDRQRDRRRAGVELADVADGRVVARDLERVGGRHARLPAALLGGRVVERLVLDRELAGLAAGLLERELRAVDRGLRLRPGRALQRQARVDRERLLRCRPCLVAAAVGLVAATGPERQRAGREQHADRALVHRVLPPSSSARASRLAAVAPCAASPSCAEIATTASAISVPAVS